MRAKKHEKLSRHDVSSSCLLPVVRSWEGLVEGAKSSAYLLVSVITACCWWLYTHTLTSISPSPLSLLRLVVSTPRDSLSLSQLISQRTWWLQHNTTLVNLNLSNSNVNTATDPDTSCYRSLTKMLQVNHSLAHLDLSHNTLSQHSVLRLRNSASVLVLTVPRKTKWSRVVLCSSTWDIHLAEISVPLTSNSTRVVLCWRPSKMQLSERVLWESVVREV